jgi:hypothetical protein
MANTRSGQGVSSASRFLAGSEGSSDLEQVERPGTGRGARADRSTPSTMPCGRHDDVIGSRAIQAMLASSTRRRARGGEACRQLAAGILALSPSWRPSSLCGNKPTNMLVGDNGRPFSLARQRARRLLPCVDRAASNHTGQTDNHGSQRTAAPAGQAGAQTGWSITGRRSTSSTAASLRPRVAVDDASGRGSIPGCDAPHTLAGVSGRQRDPGWWCGGSAAGASQ